jgi:hypothetical protein
VPGLAKMKFWSPSVSLLAVQGACIFFVAGPARAQSVTTTSRASLPTAPGPVSIPSTSPSTSPSSIQTSSPSTIYTGSDSSSTSASSTSSSSTSSAEYPSLSGVPTCGKCRTLLLPRGEDRHEKLIFPPSRSLFRYRYRVLKLHYRR